MYDRPWIKDSFTIVATWNCPRKRCPSSVTELAEHEQRTKKISFCHSCISISELYVESWCVKQWQAFISSQHLLCLRHIHMNDHSSFFPINITFSSICLLELEFGSFVLFEPSRKFSFKCLHWQLAGFHLFCPCFQFLQRHASSLLRPSSEKNHQRYIIASPSYEEISVKHGETVKSWGWST